MYDQAAEAPIINTYVPIDFTNLYRIGATQKAAVDQAINDLSTAVQTFGEFTSPSDIDVENYYNMSLGRMQDLIDQMASNPDMMKDPGFRTNFYSRLNGLNYTDLSKLKAGADALRQRQANIAKMIADGTYYKNWDKYRDLSNYDTLRNGILDELAPTAFKSVFDLAAPYVNNMKPTFFKGVAPNSGISMAYTNWMAITPEMRARELNAHLSDIIATPQGRMHLQEIRDAYPNATDDEVLGAFMDQLMTVTSYKDIETPITDEAALKLSIARAAHSGDASNTITQRTDEIKSSAANQSIRWARNLTSALRDSGIISTENPDKMSPEEVEMVNAQIISSLKTYGVPEEIKIPISPTEIYQYDGANMMKLTNDKNETPESWGDGANVQSYGYKNGDIIFTEDNKQLMPISMNYVTSRSDDATKYIDVSRILRNVQEEVAGWQPRNGANSFEYNDGDEYDPINNVVKTEGRLYITEDGLKDAIVRTYPELDGWFMYNKVDDLIRNLENGFEQNGQKYYKSIRKSEDRLINGEDTYVFDGVARNFGDIGSQNMNFNVNRSHNIVGTTATADTWGQAIGSSFSR